MKERDIRPKELFNRFLQLTRESTEEHFSQRKGFVDITCPACDNNGKKKEFDKFSFSYVTCIQCGSLYNSPRPTLEALNAYYENSKAAVFWSDTFYRETEDERREKIFIPRARLINGIAEKYGVDRNDTFADIGPGYGTFLEVIKKNGYFKDIIGIEPNPKFAQACRDKGINVINKPIELLEEGEVNAGIVVAFDLLEHLFSPYRFLTTVHNVLKKGGVLYFTMPIVSGFDIQVLWEKSDNVYPPHHINILSFEGAKLLLNRSGFEVVEISTPGKLDMDILKNSLREDSSIKIPRFISYMLNQRDESSHQSFQEFLQKNNLSSHLSCIAVKK